MILLRVIKMQKYVKFGQKMAKNGLTLATSSGPSSVKNGPTDLFLGSF